MSSNMNRRTDYGKYSATDNVTVKIAKNVEIGDTAISPSGFQSTVIDKKLVYNKVELNEQHRAMYEITFASKTQGVITKIYTPTSSVSILKTV